MQLEVMDDAQRLFLRLGDERDLDVDRKLSPSGLGDLIRRLVEVWRRARCEGGGSVSSRERREARLSSRALGIACSVRPAWEQQRS